jgi:hypothetical protein
LLLSPAMSIEPLIGLAIAGAIVPLIKLATSRARRSLRHGMKDGPLRSFLLTPLGYTKKVRNEAATRAILDDYHLLALGSHELRERNGASKTPAPADRA